MNIIWLGHGSFRFEIEDQVILVDPWLSGNPALPEDQHKAALEGVTHILITHGHGCGRHAALYGQRDGFHSAGRRALHLYFR